MFHRELVFLPSVLLLRAVQFLARWVVQAVTLRCSEKLLAFGTSALPPLRAVAAHGFSCSTVLHPVRLSQQLHQSSENLRVRACLTHKQACLVLKSSKSNIYTLKHTHECVTVFKWQSTRSECAATTSLQVTMLWACENAGDWIDVDR